MAHTEWRLWQHGINFPQAFGRHRLGAHRKKHAQSELFAASSSLHALQLHFRWILHQLDPWLHPHRSIHSRNTNVSCPASLHAKPAPSRAAVPQLPWGGEQRHPLYTARAQQLLPASCALRSTHRLLLAAWSKSRPTSSCLEEQQQGRKAVQVLSWDCHGRGANTARQNTGGAVSHLGHPVGGEGHGRSSRGDDTSWHSQHRGARLGELGGGRHGFYGAIWYFHQWCLSTGCSLWERMQHKENSILVWVLYDFKKPTQNNNNKMK